MNDDEKKCPFCAEVVKAEAKNLSLLMRSSGVALFALSLCACASIKKQAHDAHKRLTGIECRPTGGVLDGPQDRRLTVGTGNYVLLCLNGLSIRSESMEVKWFSQEELTALEAGARRQKETEDKKELAQFAAHAQEQESARKEVFEYRNSLPAPRPRAVSLKDYQGSEDLAAALFRFARALESGMQSGADIMTFQGNLRNDRHYRMENVSVAPANLPGSIQKDGVLILVTAADIEKSPLAFLYTNSAWHPGSHLDGFARFSGIKEFNTSMGEPKYLPTFTEEQ